VPRSWDRGWSCLPETRMQLRYGALRRLSLPFAAYLSVEGPGISIDPQEPTDNSHQGALHRSVQNTNLGGIMRETDYMMKRLAEEPIVQIFPISLPRTICGRKKEPCRRTRKRFWIVPQGIASGAPEECWSDGGG